MTTNAFIFMWDYNGIETIVPITQYEEQEKLNTWAILKGEPVGSNPLNDIVKYMIMRAQFNPDRRYEIYAIDCAEDWMDEEFWAEEWEKHPQTTADLIRDRGEKIFSHRASKKIKIV